MDNYIKALLTEIQAAKAILEDDFDGTFENYGVHIQEIKDLLDIIQKETDLDDVTDSFYTWENVKRQLHTLVQQNETTWNESLTELFKKMEEVFAVAQTDYIDMRTSEQGQSSEAYTKTSAKKSDAGYDFVGTNQKWVKPTLGSSGTTYDFVRSEGQPQTSKDDRNMRALTSDANLQFTSSQNDDEASCIRLIMPKNSRRVEIEDLNRNFWVLAQAIGLVSAYLYGNSSPYTSLFKGILSELFQLWENVIYQWAALVAVAEKEDYPIHVEYFPLPNSLQQPYKKYDDFETSPDDETIESIVKAYGKKYQDVHLILIPFIRQENYQKNYFHKIYIPAIFFYNLFTKTWKKIPVIIQNGEPFIIDVENYKEKLGGACEQQVYYRYAYPAREALNYFDTEPQRYYYSVRVIPEIEVEVTDANEIKVGSLEFKLFDGAESIFETEEEETKRQIGTFKVEESFGEKWTTPVPFVYEDLSDDKKHISSRFILQKKAYYLGEMASSYYDSQKKYEFEIETYPLVTLSSIVSVENSVLEAEDIYEETLGLLAFKIANPLYRFDLNSISYIWAVTEPNIHDTRVIGCYRFTPSWFEDFTERAELTTTVGNPAVGYLDFIGEINKNYIFDSTYTQEEVIYSSEDLINLLIVDTGSDTRYLKINDLPSEVEGSSEDIIHYLNSLSKPEVDNLLKTKAQITEELSNISISWSCFNANNDLVNGNINTKPHLFQTAKILHTLHDGKFKPDILWYRESPDYELKEQRGDYTYDSESTQYEWKGLKTIHIDYEDFFIDPPSE